MTTRKWWPWTAANDLAAKNFMKDGLYLVRCTICKDEKHQPSGVFICPKEECIQAVAVLLELGYEDGWGEVADEWYSTWYDQGLETPEKGPNPYDKYKEGERQAKERIAREKELAKSIHDSATQSVRDTLAEPKS